MFRCLASLVRIRPGVVPRDHQYYQDTMTSCRPFRFAWLSFARRYHTRIRFAPASWIRFLPAWRIELTTTPSWLLNVEMTGSPKFLGDPKCSVCTCSNDSGETAGSSRNVRKRRFQNYRAAPARGTTKALTWKKTFEAQSHGFRTGCLRFAVSVTTHHARLASGRWSNATRRGSHPQGHCQRFQIQLHFIFPLRQASWRNPLIHCPFFADALLPTRRTGIRWNDLRVFRRVETGFV